MCRQLISAAKQLGSIARQTASDLPDSVLEELLVGRPRGYDPHRALTSAPTRKTQAPSSCLHMVAVCWPCSVHGACSMHNVGDQRTLHACCNHIPL